MKIFRRKVYLVKVEVVGFPFGYANWSIGHSNLFITRFRVKPDEDKTYTITDVNCKIVSCVEINKINGRAGRLVDQVIVSRLKMSFIFDSFTVCERFTFKKLKRILS